MKRSMGMDGPKAVFASAKSGEIQRKKAGKIKTRKLPTSIEELDEAMGHEHRLGEQRTLNPPGRGSSPR